MAKLIDSTVIEPRRTAPTNRTEILHSYRRHVNRGYAKLFDFMGAPLEVRSEGSLVYDEHEQAYLDCGGYGVFIVGHCHPDVVAAVRSQLERHPLSTRVLINPEIALAAEQLVAVTPAGLDFVWFANSGAEATEAAIKIARLHGKNKLLAMDGGFHGKTLGALSVTGRPRYQVPFMPLIPDVTFLPFGDGDALQAALQATGDQACVILEPIQAEGGVIMPPAGYLREVKDICVRSGAMLIVDEIQTGMGRLGTWWGIEREAVVPDVLLVGKSLSGGVVPVAAAVATAAAFEPLNQDPVLHTSTFAGSPLAMVAARAAIEVVQREGLVSRAQALGDTIIPVLRATLLQHCADLVSAVRGQGLLIGIEFHAEHLAGDFMMELLRRRVIVSHSLNAHRVVRLTPPAVLSEAECDWLFGAVEEAARALHGRYSRHTA